jgi:acyl carrier protein
MALKREENVATAFEKIKAMVVEQLGVDDKEVVPTASFVEDLGADSLDLVELIMSLEEAFSTPERKIEIPDEAAEKIVTIQDALDYLKEQGIDA